MTCTEATTSLGAYVVGALDAGDRTAVEQHLHDCPGCRDELAGLAGLPGLMSRLTLEDVTAEPPVPPVDLYERVAARARQEVATAHRRSRVRWLAAVAAAAVLLAGAGIGIDRWRAGRRPTYSLSAAAGGVHMSVVLTPQASGTGLAVTVSGLPEQEHCRLVAIGSDGTRDRAGSWTATYTGQANVTGSTSIPRSTLIRLVLIGSHGQQLVTVPV